MISLQAIGIQQGSFSLREVSLHVPAGCYALLQGPSGCGKTTLLEIIAGLRQPNSGRVLLNGVDATDWSPARRGLGYVPQDTVVFKCKTVRENLRFGLELRNFSYAEQQARVAELAEQLDLHPLLERSAESLSGGEAQRVALGRALAFRPSVLLLDEPLNAVDEQTRDRLLQVLHEVATDPSITVLHVTHHPTEVESLADLVLELKQGQLAFYPSR